MKRSKKASLLSVIVGMALAVIPIYIVNYDNELIVLLMSIFFNGIIVSAFELIKTYYGLQEEYKKLTVDRWKNTILLAFNSLYFASILTNSLSNNLSTILSTNRSDKVSAIFLTGCSILALLPFLLHRLIKREIEIENERKKLKK
ncbi:TPA: hypothetical protein ACQOFQ_001711 [Streptococcus pyogenes]